MAYSMYTVPSLKCKRIIRSFRANVSKINIIWICSVNHLFLEETLNDTVTNSTATSFINIRICLFHITKITKQPHTKLMCLWMAKIWESSID